MAKKSKYANKEEKLAAQQAYGAEWRARNRERANQYFRDWYNNMKENEPEKYAAYLDRANTISQARYWRKKNVQVEV